MTTHHRPFNANTITVALVRQLIAAQFPQWVGLPIVAAVPQGWDNRTFRLGEDMSVRLPSAAGYVPQVEKEHRYLPYLAARVPLPIPVPVAQGAPGASYPFPWSVYRWLPGEPAATAPIGDLPQFATDLAHFFAALQGVDATGGPPPGVHSAFRGGPLTTYDAETRRSIVALGDAVDGHATTAVWNAALAAAWQGSPVWFHGDVAVENVLVHDGRLSAVIDWGCAGVGDPACDTVLAWTVFAGASRAAFRAALPLDAATWARGRGWAVWKALITLAADQHTDLAKAGAAHRVIETVLADHQEAA